MSWIESTKRVDLFMDAALFQYTALNYIMQKLWIPTYSFITVCIILLPDPMICFNMSYNKAKCNMLFYTLLFM